MKGIFERRKSAGDYAILALGGIFLILAIASVVYTPEETGKTASLLFLGIVFTWISFAVILINRKAYFIIENGHISARFNWKQKIECDISDVSFVACNEQNLTIEIKNKAYQISMLANAWELCAYIKERMPESTESPDKRELAAKLKKLKKSWNRDMLLCMFPCVFMLVILTMIAITQQFTPFYAGALTAGLVLMCLAIFPAVKGGKKKLEIIKLEVSIVKDSVLNTPISGENVVAVYIDPREDLRFIVFEDCEAGGFYFTVENYFYEADKFDQVYISQTEKCIEDLDINFTELTRIR